jgi:signal transduction histidine kinase
MTGAEFVERAAQSILTGRSFSRRATPANLSHPHGRARHPGLPTKTDGPERLLLWVDVALKAHRLIAELRERERLQSEIVANCSHEFRTPLNIIGGYTELIRAGDFGAVPGTVLQPLTAISDATRTLLELVSDFLGYAKIEAGVSERADRPIEIATLGAELERLGQVLLEDKDVRFTLDIANAPKDVTSDPVKLRTILRNLIGNAAKFTTQGEITLRSRPSRRRRGSRSGTDAASVARISRASSSRFARWTAP